MAKAADLDLAFAPGAFPTEGCGDLLLTLASELLEPTGQTALDLPGGLNSLGGLGSCTIDEPFDETGVRSRLVLPVDTGVGGCLGGGKNGFGNGPT